MSAYGGGYPQQQPQAGPIDVWLGPQGVLTFDGRVLEHFGGTQATERIHVWMVNAIQVSAAYGQQAGALRVDHVFGTLFVSFPVEAHGGVEQLAAAVRQIRGLPPQ
jgi:hypothetical protein